MIRFFKTRFFIVLLIISLSTVAVPLILSSMGLPDASGNLLSAVLMPAQKLFGFASDGISGFTDYFTEYDRLVEENEALRKELSEMRDKVYSAEELERMNNWLYDYLEIARLRRDFTLAPASVTGHGSSNYISVMTIDQGTNSGCMENMPVITSEGIVGYISEAGAFWSKVVTVSEATSAVGAKLSRTGEAGLVSGSYSLAAEGLLKMTYLSPDSDVTEGDRVVTSGFGSVYPPELVIGYVDRVETDELSQTKTAYVKISADLSSISEVMVITSYEQSTEEQ